MRHFERPDHGKVIEIWKEIAKQFLNKENMNNFRKKQQISEDKNIQNGNELKIEQDFNGIYCKHDDNYGIDFKNNYEKNYENNHGNNYDNDLKNDFKNNFDINSKEECLLNSKSVNNNIAEYKNHRKLSDIAKIQLSVALIVSLSKSGHPGAAISLSGLYYDIFKNILYFDKTFKDYFVISNGHTCVLFYIFLFLKGLISYNQLISFRQLKISNKNETQTKINTDNSEKSISKKEININKRSSVLNVYTPGHPEFRRNVVDATTGPLGQGIANAVGYAISLKKNEHNNVRKEYSTIRNDNPGEINNIEDSSDAPTHINQEINPLKSIFSVVFCIFGDGCYQEGLSHESFSLAGHLRLNNLIFIYDANNITIDGNVRLSMSDNQIERLKSYNLEVVDYFDETVLHERIFKIRFPDYAKELLDFEIEEFFYDLINENKIFCKNYKMTLYGIFKHNKNNKENVNNENENNENENNENSSTENKNKINNEENKNKSNKNKENNNKKNNKGNKNKENYNKENSNNENNKGHNKNNSVNQNTVYSHNKDFNNFSNCEINLKNIFDLIINRGFVFKKLQTGDIHIVSKLGHFKFKYSNFLKPFDKPLCIIYRNEIASGTKEEGSNKTHGAPLKQDTIDEFRLKNNINGNLEEILNDLKTNFSKYNVEQADLLKRFITFESIKYKLPRDLEQDSTKILAEKEPCSKDKLSNIEYSYGLSKTEYPESNTSQLNSEINSNQQLDFLKKSNFIDKKTLKLIENEFKSYVNKKMSTRKDGEECLRIIMKHCENIIIGSADLTPSCLTKNEHTKDIVELKQQIEKLSNKNKSINNYDTIKNNLKGLCNNQSIKNTNSLVKKPNKPFNDSNEIIDNTYEPINNTYELIDNTYELINNTNEPICIPNEPINNTNEPINSPNELINNTNELINNSNKEKLFKSPTNLYNTAHVINWKGNYLHFGIREHAMLSISNGISYHHKSIPIISTFLNFITYAWHGIRLACLSKLKVIYILTHDSICLGEDGPTHAPIEVLSMLRLLPNLKVLRPCNGIETRMCFIEGLKSKGPCAIVLSRQDLLNEGDCKHRKNLKPYRIYVKYLEKQSVNRKQENKISKEKNENVKNENEKNENEKNKNEKNENVKNENEKNENEKNKNEKNENEKNENVKNKNEKNKNEKNKNEKNKNEKNENEKNENEKNENVKNKNDNFNKNLVKNYNFNEIGKIRKNNEKENQCNINRAGFKKKYSKKERINNFEKNRKYKTDITILATGSEVDIAIKAAEQLPYNIEVLSVPDFHLLKKFRKFKNFVVSIEAGSTLIWAKYSHYQIGINRFGKSGKWDEVYEYFGFSVENVMHRIEKNYKKWLRRNQRIY